MPIIRTVVVFLLVALTDAVVIAQRTGGQTGPGQLEPPTALVMGRVVDADSNAVVSGVVIGLVPEVLTPAAAAANPQPVLTDPQGRFVIRQVPNGRYTVTAAIGGSGYTVSGFLLSGSELQI